MTDEFITYFNKHLEIKYKWVFCFMDENTYRTNLEIESWHRLLKYDYLNGKKNKRCDLLLLNLIKISDAFEYKMKVTISKGTLCTYKRKVTERHNLSEKIAMNLLNDGRVQVIYRVHKHFNRYINTISLVNLLSKFF